MAGCTHDEEFMDWIDNMPAGFLNHLWVEYNQLNPQQGVTTLGDNFTNVGTLDQFMHKRAGDIDLFEKLLMENKITLKDLTRRSES